MGSQATGDKRRPGGANLTSSAQTNLLPEI